MSAVALVASLLAGAAFVLAGASKLAAGERWPVDARALGAPGIVIPVLPWVELAVGAGLVTRLAVPAPAVAAVVLLTLFSALLVPHVRAEQPPSCACFGAWSASPVGVSHLVRNAVLVVLAVLAMWG